MIDPHHKLVINELASAVQLADFKGCHWLVDALAGHIDNLGVDFAEVWASTASDPNPWEKILTEWIEVLIRDHQQEIV